MPTVDSTLSPRGSTTPAPIAEPLPRDALGRVDVPAIAAAVNARAERDPQGAHAQYVAAQSTLGPVEQGELARATGVQSWSFPHIPLPSFPGLPGIPGLPGFPGLPHLPDFPGLPGLPNPIDIGRELLGDIKDLVHTLSTLPHAVADKLADSMRGDKARVLTPEEKAQIKEAYGDRVDLDKVRIVDGPGNSPIAKAAFDVGGNPAITVGNTIYIRHDQYAKNLATSGNTETLLHEFTHVVQYKEMGYGSFATKYAGDLAKYGGDRNKVYRYDERNTTFAQETIEGQAQMVGDYAALRNSADPQDRAKAAEIAGRLKGTGIYGL